MQECGSPLGNVGHWLRIIHARRRLVAGIDSKSTSATVNDIERLPTTLSFYLCYMETNKIPLATANDPRDCQRLAVNKFGAKSSNLNEDFERL